MTTEQALLLAVADVVQADNRQVRELLRKLQEEIAAKEDLAGNVRAAEG